MNLTFSNLPLLLVFTIKFYKLSCTCKLFTFEFLFLTIPCGCASLLLARISILYGPNHDTIPYKPKRSYKLSDVINQIKYLVDKWVPIYFGRILCTFGMLGNKKAIMSMPLETMVLHPLPRFVKPST